MSNSIPQAYNVLTNTTDNARLSVGREPGGHRSRAGVAEGADEVGDESSDVGGGL